MYEKETSLAIRGRSHLQEVRQSPLQEDDRTAVAQAYFDHDSHQWIEEAGKTEKEVDPDEYHDTEVSNSL